MYSWRLSVFKWQIFIFSECSNVATFRMQVVGWEVNLAVNFAFSVSKACRSSFTSPRVPTSPNALMPCTSRMPGRLHRASEIECGWKICTKRRGRRSKITPASRYMAIMRQAIQ